MAEASPSVEQRLARLEALADITNLVARYALGADRLNDPAIMGPLFTADGTWSAKGFAALEGREAVAKGLSALAADKVLWSIHYMIAPVIMLADDSRSGTCQWYLWELCTMQQDDGPEDQWFGGWYDSQVTLTKEGWQFCKVILDVRVQGPISPALTFKKQVEL